MSLTKKKLLLVVGAGASIDFGMPSVEEAGDIINANAQEWFPLADRLRLDYTVPNYFLAWLVRVHRINTAAVWRPARREKTATAGLFQAPVASREKAEALARRANGEAYADIALTYGVAHTTILRLCEARGPES